MDKQDPTKVTTKFSQDQFQVDLTTSKNYVRNRKTEDLLVVIVNFINYSVDDLFLSLEFGKELTLYVEKRFILVSLDDQNYVKELIQEQQRLLELQSSLCVKIIDQQIEMQDDSQLERELRNEISAFPKTLKDFQTNQQQSYENCNKE